MGNSKIVTLHVQRRQNEGDERGINSAEETTVYMVDYTSTPGVKVTIHKWLTESDDLLRKN
ncbi:MULTISPECIES: DUF1541 domain-containing protein [Lysinibacillus]|uniref:DUF1541 domain-containing protein n=1 Tax=Lysinibacillus TaxID=400634 RepID=UPI000825B059|nr:hypothetical protein BFM98_10375 [Lysinibacillus sp. AR18-8]